MGLKLEIFSIKRDRRLSPDLDPWFSLVEEDDGSYLSKW